LVLFCGFEICFYFISNTVTKDEVGPPTFVPKACKISMINIPKQNFLKKTPTFVNDKSLKSWIILKEQ
jgi:hypothetical protein